MRPLLIELEDFGSFAGSHGLDLSGVTRAAVVGENGAGKSTLVYDALGFALAGVTRAGDADSRRRIPGRAIRTSHDVSAVHPAGVVHGGRGSPAVTTVDAARRRAEQLISQMSNELEFVLEDTPAWS